MYIINVYVLVSSLLLSLYCNWSFPIYILCAYELLSIVPNVKEIIIINCH